MTTPTPTNAPPGTEVVCMNDDAEAFVKCFPASKVIVRDGLDGLKLGNVYTVKEFAFDPAIKGTVLRIVEIYRGEDSSGFEEGYHPARFRLLHRAASPSYYKTQRELEDACHD